MHNRRALTPLCGALVFFSIVSECGASIYSASEEAIKEFPDMDVSLRGAGRFLLHMLI